MTKKLLVLLFALFLINMKLSAQSSFYDINTIQLIEITFTQSNWDYMLDTAAAGTGSYIMASSISINGIQFDSVGIKYKGNSSYNPNQVKNPFHIELDTYKDQNYQGFSDIKLGNAFKDPSFLREVLSYEIVRNYMAAPRSNYANVYVNNSLIGLYSNSESIGKKFIVNHFGSNENSFFKCNPINGAGPGSSLFPNLVYLGEDSSLYYSRYELQSDQGWFDLINLCDTLSNHTSEIENILNVNEALWMLAFDNVLVNLDSYIGGFSQNYYLYKDDYNRFRPIVWDLNESFGTFSMTGTSNLNTTTQKQQMTHLLHASDNGWPLIQKLLSIPMYKRMYVAHMRTILAENFTNNSYYTDGLALQNLISASVNADPHKFFTYSNFTSNLTTDVNFGNGLASGLTNLMNGRNAYLSALVDFTAVQPVISEINVSNSQPDIGASVNISASILNASGTGVYIMYRHDDYSPFNRLMMLDDGLHGDGAANDGNFGSTINITSGKTEYYFYAENNQAGIFSPQRAELEFYTLFTKTSGDGDVVINEFLASNATIMSDHDGEYDDWVELYNHSTEIISLDSMYLSDSYINLYKWKFPAGTVILPDNYLIVWADGDTLQTGLHANFKLSAPGEKLALTHASAGIMDSITFGLQSTDISMQRCPNDTGGFVFAVPSFGLTNHCANSVSESKRKFTFSVYPNPFADYVFLNSGNENIRTIRIINMMGQMLLFSEGDFSNAYTLNLSQLPPGMYCIILNNAVSQKIIKQ
jgi:hypothetical protein